MDILVIDDDCEMRPFPGRHRVVVDPAGRARRTDRRTRIRAAHPELIILVRDIKARGARVRGLAAEKTGVLFAVSRATRAEPAGQRENLRVLLFDTVEARRLDAVALGTRTRIGLAQLGRIRCRPALLLAVELMRCRVVEVAVQVPDAEIVLPDRRFIHLRGRVEFAVVGGDLRRLRERRNAHPDKRFALGVPGVDFVVEDSAEGIREAQVGRNAARRILREEVVVGEVRDRRHIEPHERWEVGERLLAGITRERDVKGLRPLRRHNGFRRRRTCDKTQTQSKQQTLHSHPF